jgi:hypothetical protein
MQPLIQDLSTTLAAGPGVTPATAYGVAGYLGWVLLSGLVGLVAVIWFLRQPAENWPHRDWSKIARVLTILYLAPPLSAPPSPSDPLSPSGTTGAAQRARRRLASSPWPNARRPTASGHGKPNDTNRHQDDES